MITYSLPSYPRIKLHVGVWIFALLVAIFSFARFPEGGADWHRDIGPSVRAWWPAPWEHGLPIAPWGAMLMSPLGSLPDRVVTTLTNASAVVIIGLIIQSFNAPWWTIFPVILTPSGYFLFSNGQTEWLILLGLLFYNGFDIFLLVLKPQVAIYTIISRIRRAGGRWQHYLLPAVVGGAASLIIWPLWPLQIHERYTSMLIAGSWNSSLWPWSIPIGLWAIWQAWRSGDDRWGIVASPLLFPYVNLPSYLGLLIVLATRWPRATLIVWALTLGVSIILYASHLM